MPNIHFNVPIWELTPTPDSTGVLVYGPSTEVHHHALDGSRIRTFEGHDPSYPGKVAKAVFHPLDGRLVTAGGDTVKIWDWGTGSCLHTFVARRAARGLVVFSSGKYAVSAHGDSGACRFYSWNLESLKAVGNTHINTVDAMVLSARNDLLITAPGLNAWRLVRGRPSLVAGFLDHPSEGSAIAACDEGRLVATSDTSGIVRVFDMTQSSRGQLLHVLSGHREDVRNLSFLDGDRLLSAGVFDHSLRLWSMSTGRSLGEIHDLPGVGWPGGMAVSLDHKRAAVAGYDEVVLIDIDAGSTFKELHRWTKIRATNLAFVGTQLMASVAGAAPSDVTVVPLSE